jgi:hypothetical protein
VDHIDTHTIVKTGVRLKIIGSSLVRPGEGIYGDLHTVGSAAIIYYPHRQLMARPPWHGTLDLSKITRCFTREGGPFDILVCDAGAIVFYSNAAHPEDLAQMANAGVMVVAPALDDHEAYRYGEPA